MKKIHINFMSFGFFGSEPVISRIIKEMQKIKGLKLSFFGLDEPRPMIQGPENEIKISFHYARFKKNRILRRVEYIKNILKRKNNSLPEKNLICYFPGCSFLAILLNKPILILTSFTVSKSRFRRVIMDNLIRFESLFFYKVIVFSKGMRSKLLIKKSQPIQLGANYYVTNMKKMEEPNFLYIGTLFNRNILDCVTGFHDYLNDNGKGILHIICNGDRVEANIIENYISINLLKSKIKFYYESSYPHKSEIFNLCEVGISYIPITKYYDIQPATKTFEYLLNGMFVIATKTTENQRFITKKNGILIDDSRQAIKSAFSSYSEIRHKVSRSEIKARHSALSWSKIMSDNISHFLDHES